MRDIGVVIPLVLAVFGAGSLTAISILSSLATALSARDLESERHLATALRDKSPHVYVYGTRTALKLRRSIRFTNVTLAFTFVFLFFSIVLPAMLPTLFQVFVADAGRSAVDGALTDRALLFIYGPSTVFTFTVVIAVWWLFSRYLRVLAGPR